MRKGVLLTSVICQMDPTIACYLLFISPLLCRIITVGKMRKTIDLKRANA